MILKGNKHNTFHGILFVALFACSAFYLSETAIFKQLSFSPLIVGILLGMLYANTLSQHLPSEWIPGINFSSKKLLRAGIVLYGFRLTFQSVIQVGYTAILIDALIITGTLLIGIIVGKILKMDQKLAILTSTGSAICGAAAVLGAEPVLNSKPYKTAIAVSTVVLFGTLSMFLYPFIYRSEILNLTPEQWGVFSGSTIHEVAHVVGAGNGMNAEIASTAIIVKMIRVMMLAPVLLIFSMFMAKSKKEKSGTYPDKQNMASRITIPWFAFGFMGVILFNSIDLLPTTLVDGINYIDTFLLTMAMTALGMGSGFDKFKQAGVKPFVLALILYIWLIAGGYLLTKYLV